MEELAEVIELDFGIWNVIQALSSIQSTSSGLRSLSSFHAWRGGQLSTVNISLHIRPNKGSPVKEPYA